MGPGDRVHHRVVRIAIPRMRRVRLELMPEGVAESHLLREREAPKVMVETRGERLFVSELERRAVVLL